MKITKDKRIIILILLVLIIIGTGVWCWLHFFTGNKIVRNNVSEATIISTKSAGNINVIYNNTTEPVSLALAGIENNRLQQNDFLSTILEKGRKVWIELGEQGNDDKYNRTCVIWLEEPPTMIDVEDYTFHSANGLCLYNDPKDFYSNLDKHSYNKYNAFIEEIDHCNELNSVTNN